jgi:hypothetical protein
MAPMTDPLPRSLLIALAVQFVSQAIKFLGHSFRLGRPSWRHLVTFGGMPSAHSAFVTAVAVAVGVSTGFASDVFAVAAVFGCIVIFDAYKLRGNVQKQAKVLNRLQASSLQESERVLVNEWVGHSVPEVAAGIALALAVATPLALWWK